MAEEREHSAPMKMNHVSLAVADVAGSQQFYEKYFDFNTTLELPHHTLVMMDDGGGLILNLSNFQKDSQVEYPRDFHVGFYYETSEEVDAMHARMLADGLDAAAPKRQPGRYGYYYQVPGGVVTEVACLSHGR